MKVFYITHGRYLNPGEVVAGNSVRGLALIKGLLASGIDAVWAYPRELGPPHEDPRPLVPVVTFRDTAHLHQLVDTAAPDLVLVGYWELLAHFPENYAYPVMLDAVAPRLLESQFENPDALPDEIQRVIRMYRRADRFLCGSKRQRHFLLPWLMMAGFDCRFQVPVDVVPISGDAGPARTAPQKGEPWCLVTGGVSWPWRNVQPYLDAARRCLAEETVLARLVLLQGAYVYGPDAGAGPKAEADCPSYEQRLSLLPYGEMERLFAEKCHIGIETAEHNVERHYSNSFRSMEFLRAGLPVIISDYLELAQDIAAYDAGWTVGSPDEIFRLLPEITRDPGAWRKKSENARRLVSEQFHFAKTIQPVVEFLQCPVRPNKAELYFGRPPVGDAGPSPQDPAPETMEEIASNVADAPDKPDEPAQARVRRQPAPQKPRGIKTLAAAVFRGVMRLRPFAFRRPEIAMITRSDIFPADHGAAVKIDRTAWALSCVGMPVRLIGDSRKYYSVYENGKRHVRKFPWFIRILAPSRKKVRQRLKEMGVPESDAFLYFPMIDFSYIIRVLYIGFFANIRLFQAEFPAYARAAVWGRRCFGAPVLMVEHNVEHRRLISQYPDTPAQARQWLKDVEVVLANYSDAVVTVSHEDKAALAADGVDPDRIFTVPHGVDLDRFRQSRVENVREKFSIPDDHIVIAYHGIYLYPPNLEAVDILSEEILPRLFDREHPATVVAIGPNPPENYPDPNIRFTGSVKDVAPYLKAADMAVVTLKQGGGTRMKILDYFAAEIPVVSTRKGIEGIGAVSGVHALVADDYDRIADAVITLYENREKAFRLVKNARDFVDHLDWRNIARRYLEIPALGF